MNFSSHHENRVTIDGVLFIVLSKSKRLTRSAVFVIRQSKFRNNII